ncbi:NAD(P)H-quinone oxidoreductase chain 4 [Medicago truncatula]|uniref:NAD(P)H-quinone oxidoreductase chain 4 n=1 Tax=Medicago truncatula TaxID=3880 RepID=G7ZY64_MEDTR|nr:NAD(P)H-quinone oxidoreductase chain 4 [Medicago truncatula]
MWWFATELRRPPRWQQRTSADFRCGSPMNLRRPPAMSRWLVAASCILPLVLHEMGAYELRLLYLDEMGGMTIPMPKIFTIFTIILMISFALSGMSGFVAELIVFFVGIITSQKYLFMMKILS